MSSIKPLQLLVTGATGKQGGALIRALVSQLPSADPPPFKILALTRSKTSPTAQKLAGLSPHITLVQGDFTNVPAIFSQITNPLWGAFIVTIPLKGAKVEEEQGIALVRGAVEHGVSHIAFTATDRGGDTKSDDNPTNIPHFVSKFNIEKEIIRHAEASKAKDNKLTYTFLRPVAFYENLTPDFLGKGFTSMWRLNGDDRKLQMISTADIGRIAADVFLNPESPDYKNKALSLAGDDITPAEAAKVFKDVTGKDMPDTFPLVGRGLRWALKEQLGLMFDWFVEDGFNADLPGLKRRYPFLMDFGTWVRKESAWKAE